jgi:hypothetical protein
MDERAIAGIMKSLRLCKKMSLDELISAPGPYQELFIQD